MKSTIEKIATILFLTSIVIGLTGGIIELTLWVGKWWFYPIGFGLITLVVLWALELFERSK